MTKSEALVCECPPCAECVWNSKICDKNNAPGNEYYFVLQNSSYTVFGEYEFASSSISIDVVSVIRLVDE